MQLLLLPVLDGRAILYSFVSTPEVRIGIAFGSGGSQSLPATELPGVSSWLVCFLTNTIYNLHSASVLISSNKPRGFKFKTAVKANLIECIVCSFVCIFLCYLV